MIGPAFVLAVCCAQDASPTPAADLTDAQWIERIATAEGDDYGPALRGGFDRFMEHVTDCRADQALPLIRALHERAQAGWSAESYAMVLVRAGRYDEARDLLAAQLARTTDSTERAALIQARALHALGRGDEALARRELGAALVLGSTDAEVVLALLALSRGDLDRARVTSRALLEHDPAPPWALRAWGLSMLPLEADSTP